MNKAVFLFAISFLLLQNHISRADSIYQGTSYTLHQGAMKSVMLSPFWTRVPKNSFYGPPQIMVTLRITVKNENFAQFCTIAQSLRNNIAQKLSAIPLEPQDLNPDNAAATNASLTKMVHSFVGKNLIEKVEFFNGRHDLSMWDGSVQASVACNRNFDNVIYNYNPDP